MFANVKGIKNNKKKGGAVKQTTKHDRTYLSMQSSSSTTPEGRLHTPTGIEPAVATSACKAQRATSACKAQRVYKPPMRKGEQFKIS